MTQHAERISPAAPSELPRTMGVLAWQPDLLPPFLGWAAALALNGVLPHRAHELLALRAAANCGSEFEWVEHTAYARSAGLSDDEIARVKHPGREADWSDAEHALLRAADELTAGFDVSDETWAELTQHYDTPALVEILLVVGQYTMLSMFANAAGISS